MGRAVEKKATGETPEEQWATCEEIYQHLNDEKLDKFSVLYALREGWNALDKLYDETGLDALAYMPGGRRRLDRGVKLKRLTRAETPLEALFHFIANGCYPPPELLCALLGAWYEYLNADGNASLENAFMGPPIPKAGNGAARLNARSKKDALKLELTRLARKGLTRMQAAERVAEEYESEPETIVRTIKPFRLPKPEK